MLEIKIKRIANGYLVTTDLNMPIHFPELEEALDHLRHRFPVHRSLSDPVKDPEPTAIQLDLEAYINQNKKE
jgi:hypothetical protein